MSLATEDHEELTLAIDTDHYAGNFERELFSFITGLSDTPGEEAHAEEEAREGRLALGIDPEDHHAPNPFFDDLIESRIDDPGDDGYGRRYLTIVPTPGFFNIHGDHYPNGYTGPFKRDEKHCELCKNGEPDAAHPRYPAYQSVGIFLSRRPAPEELKCIKERTLLWASSPRKRAWDTRPLILGFRLLRARTTWSSEKL